MFVFIARRMLWMLGVLFVVSIITFLLMHAVPGGPWSSEKKLPQRILDNLNAKYHLDDPLMVQYANYISEAIIPRITSGDQDSKTTGDYLINIPLPFGDQTTIRWMNFGPSFTSRSQTVNDIFRNHLPVSVQLGTAAMSVAVALGIPLGVMAALKRNTIYDYASMGIAIFGVSVPVLVMGPALQYIFGVQLRALPVSGWGTFAQMIMPSFALGISYSALLARLTRASLLQVLHEDYITTARAKGLSRNAVIIVHAMKNAMIPVITVLGPLFAIVLTGTLVTETVFNIPGLGSFFVSSITNRDYAVIMGTILLFAFFLVVANTVVDIMYAWLDPRIRYD